MQQTSSADAPQAGRLATLDAMRGIAAVAVVQFHFELVFRPQDRLAFGYLAVDIFFLLSGFVLSLSYGPRLGIGMSPAAFLLRRVIRLAPLYLIGLVAGIYVVQHTPLANAQSRVAPFLELLMLPGLPLVPDMPVFPAMLPAWSLFFEFYVANLIFAFPALHASRTRLGLVIAASALLLAGAIYGYGSLDVGALGRNFWGGFPRVCFSFFVGVAIERLQRRFPPRVKLPASIVLAGLILCLWWPLKGDIASRVFESLCVFVIFPILIYFGSVTRDRLPAAGVLLGDASYALYAIHFPIVIALAKKLIHSGQTAGWLIEIVFIIGTTILALVLARFIDEPVRGWLTRRFGSALRLKKA